MVYAGIGDPGYLWSALAEQAAAIESRGEPRCRDAVRLVLVEAQAASFEVPDGVGRVRVRRRVEATEVELPVPGDDVAEVVVDGEANLDRLESVDVGLDHAVSLISRLRGVLLTAAVYDAGVMDVHRGVAGVMNEAVEEPQFEFKIVFPYAADGDARRQRRQRRVVCHAERWRR